MPFCILSALYWHAVHTEAFELYGIVNTTTKIIEMPAVSVRHFQYQRLTEKLNFMIYLQ